MPDIHHPPLLLLCLGMSGPADKLQISMLYFFFLETNGLELEDVDHLFEGGGLSGGVFASRGHPVRPGFHRSQDTKRIEKAVNERVEG